MAKRFNKKVALAGTAVLLVMFVFAFIVIQEKDLLTSQAKLIEDGDAAKAKQDYEAAALKYLRAKARAKNDQVRLVALNRLVDLHLETVNWPPLVGVWGQILNIEPDNLAVRYARLKYLYIVADSGAVQLWQDIESEASDFLEIVEREGLVNEDTAQWERPEYEKIDFVHSPLSGADGVQRIGQYLYLLRGRAKLEIVARGAVTEPDRALEESIHDLEKAQQLDPTNANVALQIARAFIAKGDLLASRGSFDEREKARQLALEILRKTAEDSPQDVRSQMNLLLLERRVAVAEDSTLERMATFETKYQQLIEKFPEEPAVYSLISGYYRNMGANYLDKAIEAIDKARQLDPNDVLYAISAADAYNFKATIKNDQLSLDKAISILNDALELPGAQEAEGPRQFFYRNNRASIYLYLGTVYLERLIDPSVDLTPEKRQEWLGKAEDIVHEIEQIFGSGEDPRVVKWQGMLALAKGNRTEAVRKLYAVYQQLKASNSMDTQLAYVLAKIFENTSELGAAADFFRSALRLRTEDRGNRADSIDRRKPFAVLDMARLFLRLGAAQPALTMVNYFENSYGVNSQSRALRISALSSVSDFEQAEAALAEGGIDLPEKLSLESQILQKKIARARVRLRRQRISENIYMLGEDLDEGSDEGSEPVDVNQLEKQVQADNDRLAQCITELIDTEPNLVSDFLIQDVCRIYQQQGRQNKARELANLYLGAFPKNMLIRSHLEVLDIGGKVSDEQRAEIHRHFLEQISDPYERAFALGMFYAQRDEPNEAILQFREVVEAFKAKEEGLNEDDELNLWGRAAGSFLFEHALRTKQWDMAEELTADAQRYNFDQFNGDYFRARLSMAKEEYELALQAIERCVQQRPVSSQILVLRGRIKESLGRTREALADIKQAASFNPLDAQISRTLAFALYRRNEDLGDNVTTDQFLEAKEAIEMALSNDIMDLQLRGFYAEFISDSEPQRALAMRQRLFRLSPTAQNAVLLGNMAFEIAEDRVDENEKQALMEIASKSYEEALRLDPSDNAVLVSYARFCRATGRPNEAERIINESQNENLQWRYYYEIGQYEKAKEIMERIYATEPENELLLRGLLGIAQMTLDQNNARKYSEALCRVNDNVENNLAQIRVYLTIGLLSEAQLKLESFREKYPDEPTGQLFSALLLMRQGKYDEAIEMVNRSLETGQANAFGWLLRGRINRLLGNSTQAINDLVKSKSLDDNSEARVALANAYLAEHRTADAIMELSTVVDDPAATDRARLLLESIYASANSYSALRSFYARMMNEFPDNMLWVMKAASFAERQGDFETGQRLYLHAWNKSVEQGTPNPVALDTYIMSLVRGNKLQQAIDMSAKYVDSEFATVAFVGIATAKAKMNDRAAAVENFKIAAEREKDDPTILSSILRSMYDMLGPEEVEKYCSQKLAEDPNSLGINFVLYNLATRNGDYNKAVRFLDKCIEVSEPDSRNYLSFLVQKGTLLASAYQAYSDNTYLEQAITTLQMILEKMPENMAAMNNLAYLLAEDENRLDLALEYAKKAAEQSPDNPGVLDTYAYVLYKNGRFDEAAENARAALQLYEAQQAVAPVDVYEHLGMIAQELGQKNEAIGAFQKALELGENSLSNERKEQINQTIEKLSN
jgi:tetratricopeptide (TPR) repeat protein